MKYSHCKHIYSSPSVVACYVTGSCIDGLLSNNISAGDLFFIFDDDDQDL